MVTNFRHGGVAVGFFPALHFSALWRTVGFGKSLASRGVYLSLFPAVGKAFGGMVVWEMSVTVIVRFTVNLRTDIIVAVLQSRTVFRFDTFFDNASVFFAHATAILTSFVGVVFARGVGRAIDRLALIFSRVFL